MAAWALGFGGLPERLVSGAIRALQDVLATRLVQPRFGAKRPRRSLNSSSSVIASIPPRADAEKSLTDMLNDSSATVRDWSAFALGKIRTTAAVPPLRAFTADTTLVPGWWTVGEEAADAIDTIEARHTQERSGRKANHPNEGRRVDFDMNLGARACRLASRSPHMDSRRRRQPQAGASKRGERRFREHAGMGQGPSRWLMGSCAGGTRSTSPSRLRLVLPTERPCLH